jgi:hypothetical protein
MEGKSLCLWKVNQSLDEAWTKYKLHFWVNPNYKTTSAYSLLHSLITDLCNIEARSYVRLACTLWLTTAVIWEALRRWYRPASFLYFCNYWQICTVQYFSSEWCQYPVIPCMRCDISLRSCSPFSLNMSAAWEERWKTRFGEKLGC